MIYSLADCFVNPSLSKLLAWPNSKQWPVAVPCSLQILVQFPKLPPGWQFYSIPHNSRELSAEILKVTGEPYVCRDLVDRGLARAREFTWERAARETLAVFSELAAEKGLPVARGEARTSLS
jgi:hypothetical protein